MSNTQQQITAIIYDKRGRVLSVGQNSYVKSHPYQAELAQRVGEADRIFLHAEVHAITRCRDLARAHRIRVFRWNRAGRPMLARPCAICAEAIRAAGIQHIEHT
jgi:tRNA(Arg) A34 adenosine deaminase TadA